MSSNSFTNAMLLTDGYKLDHRRQYPEGTEYVYSNWTPRSNRFMPDATDGVVVFGIQYFIKKWLIETFKKEFFDIPEDEAVKTYTRRVNSYLGPNGVGEQHIRDLHKLGYLPIRIKALPEGSICPIRCPMLTIVNTDPKFFWITNFLETLMSCELWLPMTSATTARLYRKNLEEHAKKTGFPKDVSLGFLCHDFSMRGMQGVESAIISGMGYMTSFYGSETLPAIGALEKYYGIDAEKETIAGTVPACYSEDTEILTNTGWKYFKDLTDDDLVAQYNEDKSIEFVKPLEYIKDPYNGKMIHFYHDNKSSKMDILVTPNHRMIKLKVKTNKIVMTEANEALKQRIYNSDNRLITSGYTVNNGKNLSAIDKLKIAFQADGSYPSHADDYTGEKTKAFPIRFGFKKERKMERLKALLNEANISFTKHHYDSGYYVIWANVPEKFYKDFSWVDLANISYQECIDFINELQYWDGHKRNNCILYSSINKCCIDKVQAIANICGYKGTITSYKDKRTDSNRQISWTICLSKIDKYDISYNLKVIEEDYNGYVYCVSVPSKMIVVRRNNKSIICGNTEHSVMCAGSKEDEFETYKRLITEVYPNGFVSIVSDTWDLWKVMTDYMPRLKDTILARDGRVVIRPDSGTPEDIIAGIPENELVRHNGKIYHIKNKELILDPDFDINKLIDNNIEEYEKYVVSEAEVKGVYELLWDLFGGYTNEKGYKILDSHVGALYGDSITRERQLIIYGRLEKKGFCATNQVLGVGSYSLCYVTRDCLGFAMKATWCQVNGEGREIFKDPVTDSGIKKSLKGLIRVNKFEGQPYTAVDQVSKEDEMGGCLKTVFENGKLVKEYTFTEIRNRLWTAGF
jgi:nicotinic acid phosphoribosyltransferase